MSRYLLWSDLRLASRNAFRKPGFTLLAVVAATMGLAVAAGIVPARRAMSVDPMTALRNE